MSSCNLYAVILKKGKTIHDYIGFLPKPDIPIEDVMLQTKDNIILTIQRNQNQIRGFGVKRLGLFGSFVREEQNSESDIDLLVEFEPGKKTFDNLMRLYFVLKELFNQPIELVTTESLSPYIKPYIISEVEYADITP